MRDETMPGGSGTFLLHDQAAGLRGSLRIFYYRPATHGVRDPILFALSGSDRAAAYIRDCWAAHADSLNALIVAPEFDQVAFPDALAYNYGNVGTFNNHVNSIRPREVWSYNILGRLFEYVRHATFSQRSQFTLFGHSAGAQFAHRFLALTRRGLADPVICANAGWYMLPDNGVEYPAGAAGTGFGDDDLRRYLASRMIILLGEADINETEEGLPRSAAALAQGGHRLARGMFYFDHCKNVASQLDAPFGWSLSTAPGVGHDDAEIVAAAVKILQGA